ncbi:MAG: cob(I)yrinic acid a,c-diamide adenosyltransferase [Dehalococcoidales bacterium]|nr:cob(I)yrinic acid a,c-diamide adenosyltransferase [Dehalococcoidales bacterium]
MAERASSNSFSPAEFSKGGLVQIFTGEGKGKTSAALGTVLRASGYGLRVCVVAFMKGEYSQGEWEALSKLPNVKVAKFGFRTFTNPARVKPEEIEQAHQALAVAREAALSGDYELVVLDEVNVAIAWKLVELDEVVRLIEDRPANVELILTGRMADPRLVEIADLVTECLNVKHPYDKGVKARAGFDY